MGHVVKVIRFILGISRKVPHARLVLLLVALASLVSGLTNTGLIVVINTAITGTRFSLTTLGWGFLALCFGLPAFRVFSQVMLVRLTQRTLYDLRIGWCRRILSSPLRHLEELGPPRLLASLTNDLGAITEALAVLPLIFMHLAVVVGCLAYLGWLSWKLLLGLLAMMVIGLVTYQLPLLKALGFQRLAREQWDQLFGHIRAVTQGTKELKMHQPRRRALIEEDLEPTADSLRQHIVAGSTVFAAASGWGQVLFFVAIGLLIFVVPRWMDVGTKVMVGYSITLIHMMTPLEMILTSIPRLTNASVAIGKIDRLGLTLSQEPSEPEARGEEAVRPSWGSLDLVGVRHTYRGEVAEETFTLGPVDLSFEPGEIVFLVGGNGSGKTTLAKVLLGLYAPEGGEIRFGGEPVNDENRDDYRQHFSAVFADFFLFDSLLGLEDPNLDGASRRYLEGLQLARKVTIEDGNLSTTDLSQGQRKRLALLTAYLEDRPIYLFDEWAADQDPLFKEVFYRQLLPELKARGKTVFVISHDDRYYDTADRLIKLESGNVTVDRRPVETASSAEAPEPLAGPWETVSGVE